MHAAIENCHVAQKVYSYSVLRVCNSGKVQDSLISELWRDMVAAEGQRGFLGWRYWNTNQTMRTRLKQQAERMQQGFPHTGDVAGTGLIPVHSWPLPSHDIISHVWVKQRTGFLAWLWDTPGAPTLPSYVTGQSHRPPVGQPCLLLYDDNHYYWAVRMRINPWSKTCGIRCKIITNPFKSMLFFLSQNCDKHLKGPPFDVDQLT